MSRRVAGVNRALKTFNLICLFNTIRREETQGKYNNSAFIFMEEN